MQVSTPEDHITHALVGGGESITMGVSDDAALMHILSTSLYTHPKLASVREILCNAWDAHIAAGITHIPLHIEITPTKISVRDFGLGIHHSKIGEIYGTYGNSTKRNDSKSTGGFGLGSKAPFAYTDNFEVISNHEGTATVYRISKSSMEKGGKPSINVVMQVPTNESGIKVSMDIKNEWDFQEFRNLVNEVLILGGISALINNDLVPVDVLPLSQSPTGYIIHSYTKQTIRGDSPIYLRYGNVVYPLPISEAYVAEYTHVENLMDELHGDRRIIFQCEPDTISIAPSREALQLNDMTVATIKGLLSKINQCNLGKVERASKMLKREAYNKVISELKTETLVKMLEDSSGRDLVSTPVNYGKKHSSGYYTFNYNQAVLRRELSNYDKILDDNQKAAKALKELIKRGDANSSTIKFWKEVLVKLYSPERSRHVRDHRAWVVVQKHIIAPFLSAVKANPALNIDRVFMVESGGYGSVEFHKFGHFSNWIDLKTVMKMGAKKALIIRSKKDAKEFFQAVRYTDRSLKNSFFTTYMITKKPGSLEQARLVLDDLGFEVTEYLPEAPAVEWTAQQVDDNGIPISAVPIKKAKKRIGYVTLAQSMYQEYTYHDPLYLLTAAREVSTRTGETNPDPEAWVILNNKSEGANHIPNWDRDSSKIIHKLFGDKVAVVISNQAEKLKEKGVPELSEYICKHVDEKLSTNPEFRRWLVFGKHAIDESSHHDMLGHIVSQMVSHPELMAKLGLRFSVSAETAMLLHLFNTNRFRNIVPESKCSAIAKQMKGYKHPDYQKTMDSLRASKYQKFLDLPALKTQLEDGARDSESMQIAYDLTTLLVKGKETHVKLDPNRLPRG